MAVEERLGDLLVGHSAVLHGFGHEGVEPFLLCGRQGGRPARSGCHRFMPDGVGDLSGGVSGDGGDLGPSLVAIEEKNPDTVSFPIGKMAGARSRARCWGHGSRVLADKARLRFVSMRKSRFRDARLSARRVPDSAPAGVHWCSSILLLQIMYLS